MVSRVLVLAGSALALTAGTASAATINVNTTADGYLADGKCGLREAVQGARLNTKVDTCPKGETKRDTIVLRDKTYGLTVPPTNEVANVNGDLDVSGGGPITVLGKGPAATTIQNLGQDRVFELTGQEADLRIDKVEVSGGDVTPYGGADGFGGSIVSFGGKLTVARSEVRSGEADSGGGIASFGPLVVDRTTFSSNDAGVSGGTLRLEGSTKIKRMTLNSSDVASNANDVFGGAIMADSPQGVTIADSSLRGSGADTTGGAFDAYGGAIYVDGGTLKLRRSEISNNGVAALTAGRDESGAGVYVDSGATLNVINSTFFGNQAGSPDGFAGAIYNVGTAKVQHTTLDTNLAAGAVKQIYNAGDFELGTSIVTGDNTDDPCSGATLDTLGFNVAEFDDPSCGYGPQDEEDGFLNLGSLADNGGPTLTVAPSPSTDAVDFVPKGACKTITKSRDQRGRVRPNVVGGVKQKCDAGAFELGAKKP